MHLIYPSLTLGADLRATDKILNLSKVPRITMQQNSAIMAFVKMVDGLGRYVFALEIACPEIQTMAASSPPMNLCMASYCLRLYAISAAQLIMLLDLLVSPFSSSASRV